MVKKKRNSEILEEIFGTPNPSDETVLRWKRSWRYTGGRVKIESRHAAVVSLNDAGIDSLFYQFLTRSGESQEINNDKIQESNTKDHVFVVFFKPEHEVFFKLHAGLA